MLTLIHRHLPARRHGGRASLALIVAALVAAGGGLWWWRSSAHEHSAAPGASALEGRRFGGANAAQPVSVDTVRRQDMRVSVSAIGSLAAANTAVVRAQVSGVVQRLDIQEGQPVHAGQVLAQIDPRAFQATLSQAEGVLARDKAQLDGARLDLARYRDLLAKDAIPKQQLDSQATLVAQLEGTVKADQGTADNARLQLSYTRVTAPIAGRAGLKQVDLGNVTTPNDTNGIVTITQTRPIALVFAVPAAHLPTLVRLLRGSSPPAVQALERGSNRLLAEGRVAAVDNAIDASTDTVKVKALFPNADETLFPNQAVNVTLQLETLANALAVPQAAVQRGAQGFYVYQVKRDGTVTARTVKPGAVDAGWMAVTGELQPGDRVVIDGTDRLREGAKVEVIAADPAQRAGAAGTPSGRPASAGTPRGLDHLSPEEVAKVKAMSPEERRAWFKSQPQARGASAAH
ncbi:multidrug transporter subunit MdtA [Pelomonas sp. HMWF004]|nr:multidrug transporter subunit MdtA [Pelomonas sp. HMWF004]